MCGDAIPQTRESVAVAETLTTHFATSRFLESLGRCTVRPMPEELVPILRVKDGQTAATWYARLGFVVEGEHRFAAGLPLCMFLRRGANALHLSEHEGDARPNTLVYLYVDDIDTIAKEFSAPIESQPWAREVALVDPDGNRWRIGQRQS
jgi:uncharacterized glyoxalase superfamily protein PhnB